MSERYRTEAINLDGTDGTSRVTDGLTVAVSSPLTLAARPDADPTDTNPEQLLALAWATCLNATAQVFVKDKQRTAVRVEVELHDAVPGPGLEFHVAAYLSVEGADTAEAESVLADAHARCPVSKLLRGATTVSMHTEPFREPAQD